MTTSIGANYGVTNLQQLEEIQKKKQGNGFSLANAGTEVVSQFKESNNKLASQYEAQASSGKAQAADAKRKGQEAQRLGAQQKAATSAASSHIQSNNNTIDQQTSIAKSENSKLNSTQSNIANISGKQAEIKAWLTQAQPSVEEATAQIQTLTDDALAACADFGDFENIAQAMEEISAQLAPIQEEIDAKEAEKQEKMDQQAALDPSDPNYDSDFNALQGEIEGLDGEIGGLKEDPVYATGTEAMAICAENQAQIAELADFITTTSETVKAKNAELDAAANDITTQQASAAKSADAIQSAQDVKETTETDSKDTADKWQTGLETTVKVGQTITKVGQVCSYTGKAMCLIPYPVPQAVGKVMDAAGQWTQVAGNATQMIGNTGLAIHNKDFATYGMAALGNFASTVTGAIGAVGATKDAAEACRNASDYTKALAQGMDVELDKTGKMINASGSDAQMEAAGFTKTDNGFVGKSGTKLTSTGDIKADGSGSGLGITSGKDGGLVKTTTGADGNEIPKNMKQVKTTKTGGTVFREKMTLDDAMSIGKTGIDITQNIATNSLGIYDIWNPKEEDSGEGSGDSKTTTITSEQDVVGGNKGSWKKKKTAATAEA